MHPLPTLRGRRVVLKPLGGDDADALFRWINDRDLVELSSPFRPVSWDEHLHWLARVREAGDIAAFGVREPRGDRLVGSCQLVGIDRAAGIAELRIRIADAAERGVGRGSEALKLLTQFGHDTLGLERIWLEVFSTNDRAIRAYERVGFLREGTRRDAAVIDGRPRDVIVMAHWGHRAG